jgi:hypothetical protein
MVTGVMIAAGRFEKGGVGVAMKVLCEGRFWGWNVEAGIIEMGFGGLWLVSSTYLLSLTKYPALTGTVAGVAKIQQCFELIRIIFLSCNFVKDSDLFVVADRGCFAVTCVCFLASFSSYYSLVPEPYTPIS